jgi:site-specific DNA-cytosine methylase
VFGNDMVTHSKTIYDENFNHKLTLKNINEVDNKEIPAHDILTGGFPSALQYCRSSGWV